MSDRTVPTDPRGVEGRAAGANLRRAVRYGAVPITVLAGTSALETGERLSLSQAFDGLKHAFHISDFQLGLIPAAMIMVGLFGSFPFGHLADRARRTFLLAGGVAVWTTCMVLGGFAPGYGTLFASRLGVGFVEANGPAAWSLVSDYYPVEERAKRMGLYQSGGLVGAIVGLLGGGVAVAVGGWRWAFWMWVPFGALVALAVARLPEPVRGEQDEDFHASLGGTLPETAEASELVSPSITLPDPPREGTLDYARATTREVYRELFRIRSMWFGVMAITISSLLLNGLQAWSVEFLKRAHHMSAAGAGGFTAVFGLGSAAGVLGGGFLADALLRRGMVNSRVYVVAFSSIGASLVMLPAFLSGNLAVTGALFVLGGVLLTLPIAPGEALMNDVVVAQLRGRAGTLRSVVRSIGALGPVTIGALSDALGGGASGLQHAIALVVPLYGIGGVVMFFAARSYPADLAYVGAETRRLRTAAVATVLPGEEDMALVMESEPDGTLP